MAWIAYGLAWLTVALFWTLAGASGGNMPALRAMPYAFAAVGSAAVMGVGVWRLTAIVGWNWRSPRFFAVHGCAAAAYAFIYSTYWIWTDVAGGRLAAAVSAYRASPITFWNLLTGVWMYLVVGGLSYAIRAHNRLRVQEAAAAEARLLAQQAQLAAIRAQINPHFLFNALHTVGALVSSDPARADQALEILGDLLRYALGAENEVPFRHEWKFTQDYLAFEQLRLGERLRVTAHADPATFSTLVPPLILQPLVENAVRHGIADRPDGGSVALSASADGDRLTLTVADDGAGPGAPGGGGLGMGSVRDRLRVLYGDRATFGCDRHSEGFSVTIVLPIRQECDLGSAA